MQQTSSRFVFKPLIQNKYYNETVTLELPQIKQGDTTFQSFPRFNNDTKHYTPAFILPVDFKLAKDLDSQIEQIYLKNLQNAQQSTEIFSKIEVGPTNQNKYCSVCKIQYQNYKKHVKSYQHKNNVNNSRYQKYIQMFCQQFSSNVCKKPFRKAKSMKLPKIQRLFPDKRIPIQRCTESLTLNIKDRQRLNEIADLQDLFEFPLIEGKQFLTTFDYFNATPNF